MPNLVYKWKRFWHPRTAVVNLSDNGYLYDPNSLYGEAYNPDVVPVEKIAEVPCLILLGEPGIGKTFAVDTQHQIFAEKVISKNGRVLSLDLKSYGNEDRLERRILNSPEINDWRTADYPLLLSFDSLDECRIRISQVTEVLLEILGQLSISRLFLQIACRTADWPDSFEEGLKKLWGEGEVQAYELAPLRRIDVAEAAHANNVDADAFLKAIDLVQVVPLAIKPITLEFLLRKYRASSSLPATQSELYLEGCRLLCEEPQKRRRDLGLIGKLSAEERLAVASRIAAASIYCNRSAIWIDIDQGENHEDDLTLEEIAGGEEVSVKSNFRVTDADIKETISTGLFSSRGNTRMGWAHRTYAEFLAARYLVMNDLPVPEMMKLIGHPGDAHQKLVPQLHETSAWLASMKPELFREIMSADPQVLLRSDIATVDAKDRACLVNNLLRLFEEEKIQDDRGYNSLYKKLKHPGLVEQLKPYIIDSEKGYFVRREAIEIAQACELQELQDEFVTVALNTTEDYYIRTHAACAVAKVGDSVTRAKLKPLAQGLAGDDPDDELKGCALRALWPQHITVDELFNLLTPPKNDHLFGIYQAFLLHDLVRDL